MNALLSTIGSRGDVQPLVALALQLKALGQKVRLCVPPDFRDWIENLGIPVTPIGLEVRNAAPSTLAASAPPSPEWIRQVLEYVVDDHQIECRLIWHGIQPPMPRERGVASGFEPPGVPAAILQDVEILSRAAAVVEHPRTRRRSLHA